MLGSGITLKITYYVNEPDKTVIRTNAKQEAVKGILETWLSSQLGGGEDENEANEKDTYEIQIHLDLSNDSFYINSDTGNKGLTCGIVVDVLRRLDSMQILDLS